MMKTAFFVLTNQSVVLVSKFLMTPKITNAFKIVYF